MRLRVLISVLCCLAMQAPIPLHADHEDPPAPSTPTIVGSYAGGLRPLAFRVHFSSIPWDFFHDPRPQYAIWLVAGDGDYASCSGDRNCYLAGDGTIVRTTTPIWHTFEAWQTASHVTNIPLTESPLRHFQFQVRARRGDRQSLWSGVGEGRVPPRQPSGLERVGNNPAQVALTWQNPLGDVEVGYGVFRSTTTSQLPSSFPPVALTTRAPRTYTDTTLRGPGPRQVEGLRVTLTSGERIQLDWNVPTVIPLTIAYQVTGYHRTTERFGPEFGQPSDPLNNVVFQPHVSSYTIRATPAGGGSPFEFSASTHTFLLPATLASNTEYALQVRGITQDGASGPWSDVRSTYTLLQVRGISFPTVEPTRLRVEAQLDTPRFGESGSQSAARMGYAPLTGGDPTWCSGGTDGWGITHPVRCDVSNLQVSTPYRFRIETRNFVGVVASSSAVKSTGATVPLAPRILNVGPGRVRIAVVPGTNPTDSRTEFAMAVEGSNGTLGHVQLTPGEDGGERGRVAPPESWGTFAGWGGAEGITVVGLQTGVTYTFRVKARNQDREVSELSEPSRVTLGEGSPQAPGVERVDPPVQPTQWINRTTFTFTLRGQPNQLRFRWDQDPQRRVAQEDPLWTGGSLTLRASTEGGWFLHLLGPDPVSSREVQVDFGPIQVDTTPPVMGRLRAQFGPEEEERIPPAEEGTSYHPNPYFTWTPPPSASPIEGYCSQTFPESQDRELTCTTVQIHASTTTAPGVRMTNLASGRYRFRVKAKDQAGNWSLTSAVFTLNLTRDDQPATIAFQSPSAPVGGDFLFGPQLQPALRFTFNDQMAATTFPRGIILRLTWRHDGSPSTELIPLSFQTTLAGDQTHLTVTPITPLPRGSLFLVQVTPAVKDKGGNPSPPFSLHFRSPPDRSQRNVVFRASQPETRLLIPPNILPEESFPNVDLDPLANAPEPTRRAVTEANAKLQSESQLSFIVPNSVRGFDLLDSANRPITAQFSEDIVINLGFQADGQGFISGGPVPAHPNRLTVAFLDERQARWVSLRSQVDIEAKTVQAPTRHFSLYSLMANPNYTLGDVIVYPVPFAPNSGDPNQGTDASGITFANLSTQATIKIYTLSGELVRTLEHTSGLSTLAWDATNDRGEKVFSGMYLYLIQNPREKKTGKLVIIR